jgi:predicted secreted hydrolase
MHRRRFLISPLALWAARTFAADDYAQPRPGAMLVFPRDYGSHPAFRTEWWYITGWLKDEAESESGFQITFFRNRPRIAEHSASRFAPRQILVAHTALSNPRTGKILHDARVARAGLGLAETREPDTDLWIDDWSLKRVQGDYVARIPAREFELDLAFHSSQSPLLQGERGYSRKGSKPAQASYYYSQPQLAVSGSLRRGGASARVAGTAWLDHEWSSEYLAPEASGWDWIGINLADGGALMAFRIRDRKGETFWAGGALRRADGSRRVFAPREIVFIPLRRWKSEASGTEYPVGMRVKAGELELELEPLMDDQELDARASTGTIYWEGAVRAKQGGRETGRGYLELTGYWKALKL